MMSKSLKDHLLEVSSKLMVDVPIFSTSQESIDFIDSLGLDDVPNEDVMDPESGEIYMSPDSDTKRQTKLKEPVFDPEPEEDEDEGELIIGSFKKGDVYWYYLPEFEEFYDIKKENLADEVDDPEDMREKDYDVDISFPKSVSRKDNKELSGIDFSNIDYYLKYFNTTIPPNLRINKIGTTADGRLMQFFISFW